MHCDVVQSTYKHCNVVRSTVQLCRAPADCERIGCNSPVSANCQLTRKRPVFGRDSLGREQRETPGLVVEWCNKNREWGLIGRDSLEREQREFPSLVRID